LFLDAIFVLILSFYMMLDGDRLVERWIKRLPPAWLPDIRLLQRHIDTVFGGFMRAQLIIGTVYGALTWVSLAIVRLPNALIFAFLAGLLMLIPFIGPFVAVIPPMLVVVLQSPQDAVVRNLIIVVIVLVVAQQITMQIVAPRVMSAQVGLHPLLLFAALLVGAKEGGVWGALFAGPVAAVLVAMFNTFFERFQQSSTLYPEIAPQIEPAETDLAGAQHAEARNGQAPQPERLNVTPQEATQPARRPSGRLDDPAGGSPTRVPPAHE
jgi:predicted PurR-regulated permease PerM